MVGTAPHAAPGEPLCGGWPDRATGPWGTWPGHRHRGRRNAVVAPRSLAHPRAPEQEHLWRVRGPQYVLAILSGPNSCERETGVCFSVFSHNTQHAKVMSILSCVSCGFRARRRDTAGASSVRASSSGVGRSQGPRSFESLALPPPVRWEEVCTGGHGNAPATARALLGVAQGPRWAGSAESSARTGPCSG